MSKRDVYACNNLTMLTDFYELTMANGFFESGKGEQIVYFDMFFRHIPDDGGYAVMAGVEQLIHYLSHLHFTAADIDYLRGKNLFSEDFLQYLADFRFCCTRGSSARQLPVTASG